MITHIQNVKSITSPIVYFVLFWYIFLSKFSWCWHFRSCFRHPWGNFFLQIYETIYHQNLPKQPLKIPSNYPKTTPMFYDRHTNTRTDMATLQMIPALGGTRTSPEFQFCLLVRLVSEHIFSWA